MPDAPQAIAPLPDTHADNGVLRRVPGACVGAAQLSLPAAKTAAHDEMHVDVDTGVWAGRVRLTFAKTQPPRSKRKGGEPFWRCTHAEPVR